jgi:hypothetical protein
MTPIDFSKKECTDILQLFDSYNDFRAILRVFERRGYDIEVGVDSFITALKRATLASLKHNSIPLNEAYLLVTDEEAKGMLLDRPLQIKLPCPSCGGGKVI